MNATVRRDGEVQVQPASHIHQRVKTAVDAQQQLVDRADPPDESTPAEHEKERGWELTSTVCGQLPSPDILFKCVDAETAVVVGSAADEREGGVPGGACLEKNLASSTAAADETSMRANPDNSEGAQASQEQSSILHTSPHDEETRRQDHLKPDLLSGNREGDGARARGSATTSIESDGAVPFTDNSKEEGRAGVNVSPSISAMEFPQGTQPSGSRQLNDEDPGPETVRPQVCVPLAGAGDSGCIGMVGVQGFSTGRLIGDDDWRDWFMHRMEPLNRGENRNVKRLKLVRPRGLPDKGRLEHVPTGIAAKVVYGSVEKISRKRGMPVYAVRWVKE